MADVDFDDDDGICVCSHLKLYICTHIHICVSTYICAYLSLVLGVLKVQAL